MHPSVFELTLMGIEENLPQAAGGPVNQKVKIRNPDEYSNYKVKKLPIGDDATAAQREILDLKYEIEKKTTLMKVGRFSFFELCFYPVFQLFLYMSQVCTFCFSHNVQDMVADNLLTNQEAFVVLQHWELHIRRRKYEAAVNASQSPIPGANNIVRQVCG
jgi:hypothetical protein